MSLRSELCGLWSEKWLQLKVLMRTQSSDAQLVKAEAEYNLCHFEHALVTYYKGENFSEWIQLMCVKGIKMNPEMEGFHHGVDKCKETISNIVRSETISNKNCFKRLLNILENKTFSRFKESRPSWNFIFERHSQKKSFLVSMQHTSPSRRKCWWLGGKQKTPRVWGRDPTGWMGTRCFWGIWHNSSVTWTLPALGERVSQTRHNSDLSVIRVYNTQMDSKYVEWAES